MSIFDWMNPRIEFVDHKGLRARHFSFMHSRQSYYSTGRLNSVVRYSKTFVYGLLCLWVLSLSCVNANAEEAPDDEYLPTDYEAVEIRPSEKYAVEYRNFKIDAVIDDAGHSRIASEERRHSHFAPLWFKNNLSRSQLPEYEFQVAIGKDVLNQFISTRVLHMVLDKTIGRAIPIKSIVVPLMVVSNKLDEISETIGRFSLEIKNIRIHKVRILGYQGRNKHWDVVDDDEGGHFTATNHAKWYQFWKKSWWPRYRAEKGTNDPKWFQFWKKDWWSRSGRNTDNSRTDPKRKRNMRINDSEQTPLIYFAEHKGRPYLRVAIKGLNVMVQADYLIRHVFGPESPNDTSEHTDSRIILSGNVLARLTDGVMFIPIATGRSKTNGVPVLQIVPEKEVEIKFGNVDVWSDGTRIDGIVRTVTKAFRHLVRKATAGAIGFYLKSELPALSYSIFNNVELTIIRSVNDFLKSRFKIQPPEIPHLLIQELRWWIQDQAIWVGANLHYLNVTSQQKLIDSIKSSSIDLHKLFYNEAMNAESSGLQNDIKMDESNYLGNILGKVGKHLGFHQAGKKESVDK